MSINCFCCLPKPHAKYLSLGLRSLLVRQPPPPVHVLRLVLRTQSRSVHQRLALSQPGISRNS